jgi:MFS family permease
MSVSAATAPIRNDVEVISLVGLAHATSHFFHLVLPPLFPWLMRDFGLSFTQAGALTTAFFVVSGFGQAAAGFAVDRFGPLRVLCGGIALFVVAAALIGFASSFPMLLAAAALSGLGNSVFHPADFTVLNRDVSQPRLGPAFSAHALSGNLGWAAAPVFVTTVAAAMGWRAAAFAAGSVALVPLALLVARRSTFAAGAAAHERGHGKRPAQPGSPFAFLSVVAVWMCFLFFLVSTMAFGALQNFAPGVLNAVYGISLRAAASMLTCLLLGGAAGIALGGVLAARNEAHERVVAVVLVAAAVVSVTLASGAIPAWAVGPCMTVIGFCTGMAGPSRDLLVRKAAMSRFGQGSFGRVYGFVYSGLDVGQSVAPIAFGLLMDGRRFGMVLAGVAVMQVLAVLTALRVGQERARSGLQPAARG